MSKQITLKDNSYKTLFALKSYLEKYTWEELIEEIDRIIRKEKKRK